MFKFEVQPVVSVPLSEGTIFDFVGSDVVGKLVILENLDAANTLTYKWQTSNDQTTWTDVAANATIAPTAAAAFLLTQNAPFIRLRASGNLSAAVAVLRRSAFASRFALVTV